MKLEQNSLTEHGSLQDVIELISDIKHKTIHNSFVIALRTAELLEKLISQGEWKSARELMMLVKDRIKCISSSLPLEAASSNVMRNLLKVIREEYEAESKKKGEGHSLQQLVAGDQSNVSDYSEFLANLKSSLLNHLSEYKLELENSQDNIAAQASEHIHTNEIILTVGDSETVEKFLESAAQKRQFQLVVVESSPLGSGQRMASSLTKGGLQPIVIPDSSVFAIMSRVNKVIIGTHAVLANGGLRASSGIYNVALAAKRYSIPVVVLSHLYEFTPVYVGSREHEAFSVCASPAEVMPHSAGQILNKVDVYNPIFDYVPPELVTLFISHQGGYAPSYVYRLLSELYHPDDYDI